MNIIRRRLLYNLFAKSLLIHKNFFFTVYFIRKRIALHKIFSNCIKNLFKKLFINVDFMLFCAWFQKYGSNIFGNTQGDFMNKVKEPIL